MNDAHRARANRLQNKTKQTQNGESDDKGAVAVVKNRTTVGLCLARLRVIRTSEKPEVSGKPEA